MQQSCISCPELDSPQTDLEPEIGLDSSPDSNADAAEPKLPSELLFIIFSIAASTSKQAAYSLAFLSRSVSTLTSVFRWKTISLTTETQVLSFWAILLTCHQERVEKSGPTSTFQDLQFHHFQNSRNHFRFPNLSWSLKDSISLPRDQDGNVNPGKYVENLFIELDRDRFLTLSSRLQNQREAYSKALADSLNQTHPKEDSSWNARGDDSLDNHLYPSTTNEAEPASPFNNPNNPTSNNNISWSTLQKIKLSPTKPETRLSGLFYHLPNIKILSLGSIEFSVLSKSLHCISPSELTLVFDGDENVLGQVLTWGSGTLPEEIEWKTSGVRRRIPSLGGLRKNLRNLHLIGKDPRSSAPGIQMPYSLIAPLKSGSLLRGSLIHAVMQESESRKEKITADLENSFRLDDGTLPIEGTQGEIDSNESEEDNDCSSDSFSKPKLATPTSTGITHLRYDTKKFSFRPTEIIVSRLRNFFQEVKPSVQSAESNEIMRSWGLGSFERLHLSWDSESSKQVSDLKKSRFSPTDSQKVGDQDGNGNEKRNLNGGWPREIKDTWTERSDRDLSPTFSHELSHAFQQTYGWQPETTPNPKPSMLSSASRTFASSLEDRNSKTQGKEVRDPEVATFVADGTGEMGNRLCGRGSEEELELLRSLENSIAVELALGLSKENLRCRKRGTSLVDTASKVTLDELKPDLRYGVRSPARLLRLGGRAALEREDRLRLFLDRSSGGKGAW